MKKKTKFSYKDFDPHKKYGRLTPVKELDCKNNKRFWQFKCDCGAEKAIYIYPVISGRSTSCGCYNREVIKNQKVSKLPSGEGSKRQLYLAYKRGASKREIDFTMTLDSFTNLTSGNCHYCGVKPTNTTNRSGNNKTKINGEYTFNGVDRIDPSVGYVDGNLLSCCKICNYAKNNLSYLEFMTWIDRLISFRTRTNNE